MAGISYGAGLALLGAAFDERVKVVAPRISDGRICLWPSVFSGLSPGFPSIMQGICQVFPQVFAGFALSDFSKSSSAFFFLLVRGFHLSIT